MNELREENGVREMKLMACYLNLLMATPKQVNFSYKIFRLSPYILYFFRYELIGWKSQSSIIVMTLLKC